MSIGYDTSELIANLEKLKEENNLLKAALDACGPKPPKAFKEWLGPFQTLVIDKGCREPIGWGFKILKKIEDDAIAMAMKTHGDIDWLGTLNDDGEQEFGLVIQWLTAEQATLRYGPQGDIVWGPRGGFKQVLYGTKAFNHRKMCPPGATKP